MVARETARRAKGSCEHHEREGAGRRTEESVRIGGENN